MAPMASRASASLSPTYVMRETAKRGRLAGRTSATIDCTCWYSVSTRAKGSRHGVESRLYSCCTAHRMVSGERAATQMGGYGCCSGLGTAVAGPNEHVVPE